jgi:hypothetical protein
VNHARNGHRSANNVNVLPPLLPKFPDIL